LRSSAASVNSFYHFATKWQEVKITLKAKRRILSHAREIVFQLAALEFKLRKVFIFNVQR